MVKSLYQISEGQDRPGLASPPSPPYWSSIPSSTSTVIRTQRDTRPQSGAPPRVVNIRRWFMTCIEGTPLMMTLERHRAPCNPNMDPNFIQNFWNFSFTREDAGDDGDGHAGSFDVEFGEALRSPFCRFVAMKHNSIGRGYRDIPGTAARKLEKRAVSQSSATMEWYRPLRSPREVTWLARRTISTKRARWRRWMRRQASPKKCCTTFIKGWDWPEGLTQPPCRF